MRESIAEGVSRFVGSARLAGRRLARSPSLVAIAVPTIAASTAAIATMFTVLLSTDFGASGYLENGRVAIIYTRHGAASSAPGSDGPGLSFAGFAAIRERARSFEAVEGITGVVKRHDQADAPSERVLGNAVTPGFLRMLSVRPALGRGFVNTDTIAGAPRVAILSHELWMSAFGGDRSVVGREVEWADPFPPNAPAARYRVIGVLPRDFAWDGAGTFWVPLSASEAQARGSVQAIGLLRPGTAVARADAELASIGRGISELLDQSRPPGDRTLGGSLELQASSLRDYRAERVGGRTARIALLGLAASVLALAVANVLFLALLDAERRRLEFGVRRALGASQRRIVQQTLIEAAALVVPAAGLGLACCPPLIRLVTARLNVAALGVVPTLDARTIAFVALLSLVVVALVGLAPALLHARFDLRTVHAGRAATASTRRVGWPHRLLVIAESAGALVVLTAAGLVTKELRRLEGDALGYSPHGLVLFAAPISRPKPAPEVVARGNDALARIRTGVGTRDAAIVATDMTVHLRTDLADARLPTTVPRSILGVSPDYFSVLDIPIVKGRGFVDTDDAAHPPVTILSEDAARRLFPGTDPVGHRVAVAGMGPGEQDTRTTVVGIARDARVYQDPLDEKQAVVYRPFSQGRPFTPQVIARIPDASRVSYSRLREVAKPLAEGPRAEWSILFLDVEVSRYLAAPRFNATALNAMAGVGLLLALIGTFGMSAMIISIRARENAVRVAIGAQPMWLVLAAVRQTARPVLLGVVSGALLSFWTSRWLGSLLHGANAVDPTVYAGASLALLLAAMAAAIVPARRALRIDPADALRNE